MNLEDKVRVTVHDLADDARFPADLAAGARRRGRRLRRRRRAGVAATTLALVASASIPYVLLHRDGSSPQPLPAATTSPPPAPTATATPPAAPTDWGRVPLKLPGGAIVTAVSPIDVRLRLPVGTTLADGNVVLDRTSGRYRPLTDVYFWVWGAPKVNRGVVPGDRRLGVIRSNGDIVWTDVTPGRDPQWSPDGTRVLATTDKGFAVIDARTGEARRHSTYDETYPCNDECLATWLPDGKRVAVPARDLAVKPSVARPDVVDRVAIHDATTGKRLKTIAVPAPPAGQDAWSPDGRRVVLKRYLPTGWSQRLIFDIDTQKILAVLGEMDLHFLPDGRLLGLDRAKAYARLYDVHGKVLEEKKLPRSLVNRQLSVGWL